MYCRDVENGQGIRFLFRQTAKHMLKLLCQDDSSDAEKANDIPEEFKNYLLAADIDAIEIHAASHSGHYRWVSDHDGRTYSVPTTLTFNAHCIEDFNRPLHTTHIKMTSLGLQGLREAFAFADTRIRYPGNVPIYPCHVCSAFGFLEMTHVFQGLNNCVCRESKLHNWS